MPTVFTVDTRNGVPVYKQVVEQIKRAVAFGTLAPGEKLPTVKSLAIELTLNPNTVSRAYQELERDGVIETNAGRGSFVLGESGPGASHKAAADVAQKAVFEAVREAREFGIGRSELEAMFARALTRWYPEEKS